MFAVIGFILFVVGIILNLVGKHTDWIIWLVLFGGALACAEMIWNWHRGGYYRHGSA